MSRTLTTLCFMSFFQPKIPCAVYGVLGWKNISQGYITEKWLISSTIEVGPFCKASLTSDLEPCRSVCVVVLFSCQWNTVSLIERCWFLRPLRPIVWCITRNATPAAKALQIAAKCWEAEPVSFRELAPQCAPLQPARTLWRSFRHLVYFLSEPWATSCHPGRKSKRRENPVNLI